MKRILLKSYLICLLLLLAECCYAQPTIWEQLVPGLDYAVLPIVNEGGQGRLHAFRINLDKNRISLSLAKDYHQSRASVHQLAKQSESLLASNGGFFSPQNQPLGLRVRYGRKLAPLKNTSWWGVFYIEDNKAKIGPQKQFRQKRVNQVQLAIQAGPRLLINGAIPQLKPGRAQRTALGITNQGDVILAVTQNAMLTTKQLAEIFSKSNRAGGLDCKDALNLDGGSSSQLYAKMKNFYLNVPNFSPITDAIVVSPL